MKKLLLISCLATLSASSLQAFEAPKVVEDALFSGINPDGTIAATDLNGMVQIFDLTTGEVQTFFDETYTNEYTLGHGHCISNNGIVVGSTTANGTAAYFKDGEWHLLHVMNEALANGAAAITPDGSRICGLVGTAEISLDHDNTMDLPAYWDVQADGSFGECHVLPYPATDFSGRAPQYVTAIDISADGKTISGQFVDCSGFFHFPIVYTQKADGEWEYTLVGYDQILPADVSLPEYPGDAPEYPQASNFMTDEEKAAYQAAYEEWISSGYTLPYPVETDYLSGEGKAQFEAALATYYALMDEWEPKNDAYYEAFYAIVEQATDFTFNQSYITPDGTKIVCNANIPGEPDPMSWGPAPMIYQPWVFTIADQSIEKLTFEGVESFSVNYIPNNDTFLANNGVYTSPMIGYVIKNGQCTDLFNYLSALSPEMKTWCDENLIHEVEKYDWENDDFYFETNKYTGLALANSDLSKILFWHVPEYSDDLGMVVGYIVDCKEYTGIANAVADRDLNISIDADGNVVTGDNIINATVYDLSGRRVAGQLSNGVYIIRATTTDGAVVAKKVIK